MEARCEVGLSAIFESNTNPADATVLVTTPSDKASYRVFHRRAFVPEGRTKEDGYSSVVCLTRLYYIDVLMTDADGFV